MPVKKLVKYLLYVAGILCIWLVLFLINDSTKIMREDKRFFFLESLKVISVGVRLSLVEARG